MICASGLCQHRLPSGVERRCQWRQHIGGGSTDTCSMRIQGACAAQSGHSLLPPHWLHGPPALPACSRGHQQPAPDLAVGADAYGDAAAREVDAPCALKLQLVGAEYDGVLGLWRGWG